jgi:hypothetical protein
MPEQWSPEVNDRIRRETYINDLKRLDKDKYQALLASCDSYPAFVTEELKQAAKNLIENADAIDAEEASKILSQNDPTNDAHLRQK